MRAWTENEWMIVMFVDLVVVLAMHNYPGAEMPRDLAARQDDNLCVTLNTNVRLCGLRRCFCVRVRVCVGD